MNINGYIKKYGNKTFKEMPFNSIDSLILCQLCYMNLEKCGPTIDEINKHPVKIKNLLIKDVKHFYSSTVTPNPMKVMVGLLIKSKRFGNIYFGYSQNHFDEKNVVQFFATSFFLPDGNIYIAYRGTDTTLLGWKEDFLITYMDEIVSQKMAVEYAKRIMDSFPKPVYLGGHSKGGNLAMYTLLKIGEQYEDRVLKVFSYDGPGFRCGKRGFNSYSKVADKFDKYITQNDLIGMVYIMVDTTKIVKSNSFLLGGHDPFGWQIRNNTPEFIYCADRSRGSKVMVEALSKWLNKLSKNDKELLIEAFFEIFKDAKTVFDLLRVGAKDIVFSKKALQKYTKVEQVKLKAYFDAFLQHYFDAFFNYKDPKQSKNKQIKQVE